MGKITNTVFELTTNPSYLKSRRKDSNDHRPSTEDKLKNRIRVYIGGYSSQESNCYVFMSGSEFKSVFDAYHADSRYKARPAIVKLTNPQTHKSIHRIYAFYSEMPYQNGAVVLSHHSLLRLVDNKDQFENMDTLDLKPGSLISYYWSHPIYTTMLSIRASVISLILALFGIILTLLL